MRPEETPEQREAELQLRERFMLQPAQQAVNAALAKERFKSIIQHAKDGTVTPTMAPTKQSRS